LRKGEGRGERESERERERERRGEERRGEEESTLQLIPPLRRRASRLEAEGAQRGRGLGQARSGKDAKALLGELEALLGSARTP